MKLSQKLPFIIAEVLVGLFFIAINIGTETPELALVSILAFVWALLIYLD